MLKSECNAKRILGEVEKLIDRGGSYRIREVCNQLSIFDWWPETLSQTKLKDMRKFLKEAIKLGYTGYVCFKVGATGCANGMWAYTEQSTDGWSPRTGGVLYKAFTPAYNYWAFSDDGGHKWFPDTSGKMYDSIKTIKQLEEAIEAEKEV